MLIEDMNVSVGSSEIVGVVGKWGVDGVSENGKLPFQHKLIHKCTQEGEMRGASRRA